MSKKEHKAKSIGYANYFYGIPIKADLHKELKKKVKKLDG